ncbi:MAG TPA: PKD domain-containing protein [Chitinophagaceae bacterium]|nr:PKD domain-containing protein [Chitinophagaceae bacterium]
MANDRNEFRVTQKSFVVKMDRKIIFTFIVISILSILLLALKLATYQERHIINMSIKSSETNQENTQHQFLTDESILFTANTLKGKDYVWDFGDGTPKMKTQSTSHFYHKPGIYQVKVLVNGRCDEYLEITILSASLKDDELKNAIKNNKPYIDGPTTVQANQPVSFSDPTSSVSWEWTVLGANVAPQTGQTATFTFPVPGEKIITLKTNGDINRTAQKTILVTPNTADQIDNSTFQNAAPPPQMMPRQLPAQAPPPSFNNPMQEPAPRMPEPEPVAEKPIIKFYTDNDFKDILEDIAFGDAKTDELIPKLCLGKETKLYINGSLISWGSFFDQIKGKEITKLEVVRNFKNKNCVQAFKITL